MAHDDCVDQERPGLPISIVSQTVKISVRALVAVLLTNGTGIAQSPSALARGFPYSSEHWSWGPFIFIFILVITFSIAGAVQQILRDEHWSHTLVVMLATLLLALILTVTITAEPGFWAAVFMLIPSIIGVGPLYLMIMSHVQSLRDRRAKHERS